MQNLMDSHDTDRLASMIVNASRDGGYAEASRFDYDWGSRVSPRADTTYRVRAPNARERDIQKLVALFQMTYVGAPMIYYGDEAGMWGGDDPDDRKPMLWADLTYDAEKTDPLGRPRTPDPVRVDTSLLNFYTDAIALRNAREVLRRGDYQALFSSDDTQIFAFRRSLGNRSAVVVLNRSGEAHSVRIPLPEGDVGTYSLTFATTDGPRRVQQDGTALLIEIAPLTGLVLTN